MTKKQKILKMLGRIGLSAFMAGLLAVGVYQPALAVNIQANVKTKQRTITQQGPFALRIADRGAKTFEVTNTATAALLVDESGNAVTSGWVTSVDISTCATGTYLVLADTSAASGFDESSSGLHFVPPLTSTPTAVTQYSWKDAPLQFGRGVGIKFTAAGCSAYVHYVKNGGND